MDAEPVTTIDLMRHGQPVGGSRFRGSQDDPLSDQGWQAMHDAVGDYGEWTAVVSSPLLRCADFARDKARRLGLAMELEPRFAEVGFGRWEGVAHAEMLAADQAAVHAFWTDPVAHPPPGAEPLAEFRARVRAAWDDLVAEQRGGHVLLVTHAGVIRVLVMEALAVPLSHYYRIDVPLARLTRLRIDCARGRRLTRLVGHGMRL